MTGVALRDAGIEQAGSGAPVAVLVSWEDKARKAILSLALSDANFTAEDVRASVVEQPPTPNVMGAIMQDAYRRGWIRPSGYTTASRPSRHASILRCWSRA